MIFVDNDRWRGVCTLYENAIYEYTVEAWTDTFRGWQQEFATKFEAGISDLHSETLEGAALVNAAASRARDPADCRALARTRRANCDGRECQKFTPSRIPANWKCSWRPTRIARARRNMLRRRV